MTKKCCILDTSMSDFKVSIDKWISSFPIKEISYSFDDSSLLMLYIYPNIEHSNAQVWQLLELQSETVRHVGEALYGFYQV